MADAKNSLGRSSYLSQNLGDFQEKMVIGGKTYEKVTDLRYGTNPHQTAAYYRPVDENGVKHFDGKINEAKARLAYEVTKIVHGEEKASLAERQAKGAFGGGGEMPEAEMPQGITKVADLLVALKLAGSRGEAKRLIEGGGIRINDDKVVGFDADIPQNALEEGFVIHKGKKQHIKVVIK